MDFQTIALGVGVVVALVILFAQAGALLGGLSSERWPEAKATILESSVKGRGGDAGFRPSVAYEYVVDGASYSADRFQFGQSMIGGSRAWAEAQVRGLDPGSTLVVYYNPRSPSVATFRRGVSATLYFGVIVTLLVFAGFAIAFLKAWA